jgi:CheY-like chemotaxis protein
MTNHNTSLELLLVEDNPADAELTIDALLATGLVNSVKWVKDGAEALELLVGSQKKVDGPAEPQTGVAGSAAAQGGWTGSAQTDQS